MEYLRFAAQFSFPKSEALGMVKLRSLRVINAIVRAACAYSGKNFMRRFCWSRRGSRQRRMMVAAKTNCMQPDKQSWDKK
jgi:hypothetical protein